MICKDDYSNEIEGVRGNTYPRNITTHRSYGPFGLCGHSTRHFRAEDIDELHQDQGSCSMCTGVYTVIRTKDGRIHSGYEHIDY